MIPSKPRNRRSVPNPSKPIRSQTFGKSSNQDDDKPHTNTAIARRGHWHGKDRPSARLDARKTSNPFGKPNAKKSNFAFVYSAGGIPCRLNHGTYTNQLQWDREPATLNYNPLLIHCAEGLCETRHPYVFVARTAFKELLEADQGCEKTLAVSNRVVPHLRAALLSKDDDVFLAGLTAIQQMSDALGPAFNKFMGSLLIQINKKSFIAKFKQPIMMTLYTLNENGGPEAHKMIKAKVPTFSPC